MAPDPNVIEDVDVEEETRLAPPWNVVVHDDPITLMTYVTMVFQRVFGFSLERAHRHMMEVHVQGRSVVWTGERERAEVFTQRLHSAQLLATLEPVNS